MSRKPPTASRTARAAAIEDVIAVFGNRNVDGPVYEILDDELNTLSPPRL